MPMPTVIFVPSGLASFASVNVMLPPVLAQPTRVWPTLDTQTYIAPARISTVKSHHRDAKYALAAPSRELPRRAWRP